METQTLYQAQGKGAAKVCDASTLTGSIVFTGLGLLFSTVVVPYIYKKYVFDRDTSMIPSHMKAVLVMNIGGSFAISKIGEGIAQKSWADSLHSKTNQQIVKSLPCGEMKFSQAVCNTQNPLSILGDLTALGCACGVGLWLTNLAQKYGKYPDYGSYLSLSKFAVPSLIFSVKRMISDYVAKSGVSLEFSKKNKSN